MKYQIEVRKTKNKGRGVFALRNFEKNEIIERCPIIYLNPKEATICEQTILVNYLFEWRNTRDGALPLGYGLIYNHSYTPNATYSRVIDRNLMLIRAIRPIKSGEEILVNYNGNPYDLKPIDWMDVKE